MSDKLFIEVDAGKEQPGTNGWHNTFNAYGIPERLYYTNGSWFLDEDCNFFVDTKPSSWLRPIQQQEGLYTHEQMMQLMEFCAGFRFNHYNNNGDTHWNKLYSNDIFTTSELFNQFINSIKKTGSRNFSGNNMNYELTGKIVAIYDTVQRTETFKTREFAIETTEEIKDKVITSYAKFQCVNDRASLLDKYSIGESVNVHFNVKGSKWEKDGKTNYITNLNAWRLEHVEGQQPAGKVPASQEGFLEPAIEPIEDLPF